MRLFLAVDLDETARASVAEAVALLRRRADSLRAGLARTVKWVDARQLHLTLHFIGEIEDDRLPGLRTALEPPLGIGADRLGLGEWGVFPGRGESRVIWVGVTAGAATLGRVHAVLAGRLSEAGIALEARPFSPHLTVGRVRVPSGTAWRDLVGDVPPVVCACEVRDCTLYRSRLSADGPSYEALMRIPFRDAVGGRLADAGRCPPHSST
jgi:2'-5' RNA ligase